MKHPSIAVVIPTRNRLVQLRTALRSVLAQTVPVSEIFIVDEASSDSTPAFLERLSLQDSRVRVIRNSEPVFLPSARNLGVEASGTDLVAFLDDDDAWAPHKLERQVEAISKTGAEWAGSGALMFTGQWRSLRAHRPPLAEAFEREILRSNVLPAGGSTVVARRSAISAVGGFDPRARYMEDWECWISLTAHCGRPALVDEALTAYRIQQGQMSSVTEELLESHAYLTSKHAPFAETVGVSMTAAKLKEFAAGRLLAQGRSADARRMFGELLRDEPSLRWVAKWLVSVVPGNVPSRLSDWRFRRNVPDDWSWAVELWLTQLMRLEIRDQTASGGE